MKTFYCIECGEVVVENEDDVCYDCYYGIDVNPYFTEYAQSTHHPQEQPNNDDEMEDEE